MYKLTNNIAIVARQTKWMRSLYLDNSYIPGCEVCVVNSHFVERGWEGEEEGTHGNYQGTPSSHKYPLDSHGKALLLCWGSVLWCGSSWLLQRWPLLLCCSCYWLNRDYTVWHPHSLFTHCCRSSTSIILLQAKNINKLQTIFVNIFTWKLHHSDPYPYKIGL